MYKCIHILNGCICMFAYKFLFIYLYTFMYIRMYITCIYVCILLCSCYKNLLLCGGGPFIRDGESIQWMMLLIVVERCPDLQLASIAL